VAWLGLLPQPTAVAVVVLSLIAGLALGFLPATYASSALTAVLVSSTILGACAAFTPSARPALMA
jgi:hypothetical protein